MGRFASTVAYYENARALYGEAFFAAVARDLRNSTAASACSTSGRGRAFWRSGRAPIAMKSSASTRSRRCSERPGRRRARAGVAVKFIEGRFEDEAARLDLFDVVTIGRAIHWLDPEPAQKALDRVVKPGGRVSVCHASSVNDGRNPWLKRLHAGAQALEDGPPRADDRDRFFAGRTVRPAPDDQGRDRRSRSASSALPTASCRCRPPRPSGSATTRRR